MSKTAELPMKKPWGKYAASRAAFEKWAKVNINSPRWPIWAAGYELGEQTASKQLDYGHCLSSKKAQPGSPK